ncbi:DUF4276 family protein [methanotrophic endosymbiont of Bathymodiolus puteoserpentis (Logatchev)]|jgi:hypothetical protein|uniref:DUF4276 family protein n=1 Tax=methanotrophic endosymbiont of Bathymodiolus puteoserpentis (Logatchev) TaxID=343235 RepID=UPI0013C72B33|nr:DUF4276 family protein [methanotrophic endosymbiont of Bathymodiolus puteoserpentis (Logatchev)]SHE22902.1 hypothetical protein BPUTEOMOX_969 [methanotrophic endosymbiont of Bathymodiolus puteoserpentis (Logatchev)]
MEIYVIAEGATEERFIKDVLAPSLRSNTVYIKPILMPTSKGQAGGAINLDRFLRNVRNTLNQHRDAVVTTMFDLYALSNSFPSYDDAMLKNDVYQKVALLESSLHDRVIDTCGCEKKRFIPYIQPYEYEGLLFSDIEALVSVEPEWVSSKDELQEIINSASTPEHINDGYETKPSARLSILSPKYKKTRHGPLIAKKITLSVIERECKHFSEWVKKLRSI